MKLMNKTAIVALLGASLAAACAPRADSVVPVSMTGAFDKLSCSQVGPMLQAERANVTALSEKQNSAATGDAIGVFLIGVPMSSVVGAGVEANLASSKGKVLALEQRAATCR